MFRWGWLLLGVVWGLCVANGARYSNQNYGAIKATLDGVNTGAPLGPLILLFTVTSVVIFVLLLIIGLIALRRKPGFWSLVVGVLLGMSGLGIFDRVHQAIR
jgi:hypothetical protein